MSNAKKLNHDILSAAVPAWTEAHAAADRLSAEMKRRIAGRRDWVENQNSTTDALFAAKDAAQMQKILDADRLATAREETESADIAALALANDRAQSALKRIEENSVPEVVEEIRARVESIADEIKGMSHRPLSAQEAIDLDAAQEWKTLQRLAQEWMNLNRAYMSFVRHEVRGPGITVVGAAAFIDDPARNHPHFQGRRAKAGPANAYSRPGSFHEAQLAWSASAPAAQFNTDEPQGDAVPRGTDPLEWLVNLVNHDAVTVHDPEHALALWQAATAATDSITQHNAEARAYSRVEYAKLTGDEDLTTVADLEPVLAANRPRGRRGSFVLPQ